MTTLDLAAIEADLERQLDRTRHIPTEPQQISIRAETLRGLIAAARAGGEPCARPPGAETAAPLCTAILDALMERWREGGYPAWLRQESQARDLISTDLDMILPVAEPMIREAVLREVALREAALREADEQRYVRASTRNTLQPPSSPSENQNDQR